MFDNSKLNVGLLEKRKITIYLFLKCGLEEKGAVDQKFGAPESLELVDLRNFYMLNNY